MKDICNKVLLQVVDVLHDLLMGRDDVVDVGGKKAFVEDIIIDIAITATEYIDRLLIVLLLYSLVI